jgi:hypothetical protein
VVILNNNRWDLGTASYSQVTETSLDDDFIFDPTMKMSEPEFLSGNSKAIDGFIKNFDVSITLEFLKMIMTLINRFSYSTVMVR